MSEQALQRIVEAAAPHHLFASIPPTLQSWLLPIEWDRARLWTIQRPAVPVQLQDVEWQYELPFWRGNDGTWFTVTPRQFLASPDDYPEHARRVASADLAFPIHAIRRRGRIFILDGVHRVVRAHLDGHRSIAAILLTATDVQRIVKRSQSNSPSGGSPAPEPGFGWEAGGVTEDFYCDEALSGRTPVEVVVETEDVLAFHHTQPYWPVHIVVVPKQHVPSLTNLGNADPEVLTKLLEVVRSIAADVEREHGAARVLTNLGRYQDSKHLHFHVASGDAITS